MCICPSVILTPRQPHLDRHDVGSLHATGNEESIKSSAEDMLESENDENNGNGGDSDNLTPFSEKKSSQELLRVESLKSQLLAKTIGLDTGFSANVSCTLYWISL